MMGAYANLARGLGFAHCCGTTPGDADLATLQRLIPKATYVA
jgi:hypothetical protein